MPASNEKRSEILGMPFGTACNRLCKILLFNLACKLGENLCFRCSKEIPDVDEFTIEHKESWMSKGSEYFWNLDNIAFSHKHCNMPDGVVRREIVDGKLWCSKCKEYLLVEKFHKEKKQRTGYALICKDCSNAKRRKVKAQGDCINCGAKRGTKPFRVHHNICVACTNKRYNRKNKDNNLISEI